MPAARRRRRGKRAVSGAAAQGAESPTPNRRNQSTESINPVRALTEVEVARPLGLDVLPGKGARPQRLLHLVRVRRAPRRAQHDGRLVGRRADGGDPEARVPAAVDPLGGVPATVIGGEARGGCWGQGWGFRGFGLARAFGWLGGWVVVRSFEG